MTTTLVSNAGSLDSLQSLAVQVIFYYLQRSKIHYMNMANSKYYKVFILSQENENCQLIL